MPLETEPLPVAEFAASLAAGGQMEAFPFTPAEWEAVAESALPLVNATLADDPIVGASHFVELQVVLAALRDRHGEHPILLETEADFTDEARERVLRYRQAEELAVAHGLPTFSVRLSLAGVLLHDLGQPIEARAALLACRDELTAEADEWDRVNWSNLLAECDRRISSRV